MIKSPSQWPVEWLGAPKGTPFSQTGTEITLVDRALLASYRVALWQKQQLYVMKVWALPLLSHEAGWPWNLLLSPVSPH